MNTILRFFGRGMEEEEPQGDIDPSTNGFVLKGNFIPETALETLLSFIPPEKILNLRRVCKAWRNLVECRSFWKQVFNNCGLDWESLPDHIKERDDSWMLFYAAAKNNVFRKNLVKNHSGLDQTRYWEILQNGGDRVRVETPPVGVEAHELQMEDAPTGAFATSYGWCIMQQKIDLWAQGLTPKILAAMVPFQFQLNLLVGTRFDCGGIFGIFLSLQDTAGNVITHNMYDETRTSGSGWQPANLTLSVVNENMNFNSIRKVTVCVMGKDNQFWAGCYGPKFSKISVTAKCLTLEEAETISVEPNTLKHVTLTDRYSFNNREWWTDVISRNYFQRPARAQDSESSETEDDLGID